jgi:hydroxyethylthiazole kinase-like uncharacterized protein yjeF
MAEQVQRLPGLPDRARDAHKGDFGRVLIVAGSPGMTGAGCMATLAAQKAGAGLVTLALPESLNVIGEVKLTSAMSRPLPEPSASVLGSEAADAVLAAQDEFDVMALGPGIGRARQTQEAARRLVKELSLPLIVDADGLNALAGHVRILKAAGGARLLTPHPGEMARLLGHGGPGDVQGDRIGVATAFAREHGVILALKGAGTVVTDGERVYVNPSGNPGMATGGTGDVLTGLVAGLLCQGLGPFDALQLAVFVHGLAGDLAARVRGELSMTAEDVLDFTPEAFQLVRAAGKGAEPGQVLARLDG